MKKRPQLKPVVLEKRPQSFKQTAVEVAVLK
jgi:hypothetical protein